MDGEEVPSRKSAKEKGVKQGGRKRKCSEDKESSEAKRARS